MSFANPNVWIIAACIGGIVIGWLLRKRTTDTTVKETPAPMRRTRAPEPVILPFQAPQAAAMPEKPMAPRQDTEEYRQYMHDKEEDDRAASNLVAITEEIGRAQKRLEDAHTKKRLAAERLKVSGNHLRSVIDTRVPKT